MMKRRRFLKTMIAAPAVPALATQQAATAARQQPVAPGNPPAAASSELPKLDMAVADDAGEMIPRFFSPPQFAALRKLCDVIMPPIGGAPGALDARAPEFLDFLIRESPAERQQLYRAGLDALNAQARKRFAKPFADVDAAQAAALFEPLREPWTYDPPADPLVRFLHAAKHDVRTATTNSREASAAASAAGGRRGGGVGLYWYPLD